MSMDRRRLLASVAAACCALPTHAEDNPVFDVQKQTGARRPKGWVTRRATFANHAAGDAGAVVFAGDSITHTWINVAQYFPQYKVANRGISGDTTLGLMDRLDEDVVQLSPRALVLLIGTNDLGAGAAPEAVATNIATIVDYVRQHNPGCLVVLCRIMPRGAVPGHFPEKIRVLNAKIDALARRRKNVTLCDTWSIFADASGQPSRSEFPDMLHPNEIAHAKWAIALKRIFAAHKL